MKNVSSEGILGVRKTIQYSLEACTLQAIRIYAEMIIAYFLIFSSRAFEAKRNIPLLIHQ